MRLDGFWRKKDLRGQRQYCGERGWFQTTGMEKVGINGDLRQGVRFS